MKQILSSILFFVSSISLAQKYDGLAIEKRNIDKNNNIYTLGKEFIFQNRNY
jgi:hypothetical protein